jgi:SSS family solute:Na+ symporter
MKRIVIILWGFTGLFAIILYSKEIRNPDLVWGQMTLDLVGSLGLGLVGLMIACMLSALMSTADCQMITAAGLFTKSFYNKILPSRSENHYVWVGRIFSVAFIFLSAALATAFDDILSLLKFSWGFFAVFAASFWLGLLWRRANRVAAWVSISVSALLFILGPPLLPTLFPSMRTTESLLLRNADRVVENTYIATRADVEAAGAEVTFEVGDAFTKTYHISGQSIFWEQGVDYHEGQVTGRGSFHLDLWVLSKAGLDLEANPRALNETIRFLMRIVIPFGLVVLVSLIVSRQPTAQVERFFVKMRLPVTVDAALDSQRLRDAQGTPGFGADTLMFPQSNWEFQRCTKTAFGGFAICSLVVVALLLVLYFLVR